MRPRSAFAAGATRAGAWAGLAAFWAVARAAASSTSCLRIRPPTPVPARSDSETPRSLASLRTSGVTYPSLSPVDAAAACAGAGAGCGWAAGGADGCGGGGAGAAAG